MSLILVDYLTQATARGKSTRRWAAGVVAKRRSAKALTIAGRERITPPLQDDQERGQGDSTNSRLHRLLKGQKQ